MFRNIESCESLVCSVLTFCMYHINDLKVKEIQVLFRCHLGSERLKIRPIKVELLEDVTDLFRTDWEGIM